MRVKLSAEQEQELFRCVDCRVNTHDIKEYYMVTDEVWGLTGLPAKGGMLCIGCLEGRIGRKLSYKDFSHCLLNEQARKSDRYQDRFTCLN